MHDNFENPHMFMGTFLWDIYYKPLGLSDIANPRPKYSLTISDNAIN